jgi:hypothetical protein
MAYGTTINIITVTPDPEGMLNQSGEHEMGRTEIFAPKVKTAQGVKKLTLASALFNADIPYPTV